jgi:hypothetical protein
MNWKWYGWKWSWPTSKHSKTWLIWNLRDQKNFFWIAKNLYNSNCVKKYTTINIKKMVLLHCCNMLSLVMSLVSQITVSRGVVQWKRVIFNTCLAVSFVTYANFISEVLFLSYCELFGGNWKLLLQDIFYILFTIYKVFRNNLVNLYELFSLRRSSN